MTAIRRHDLVRCVRPFPHAIEPKPERGKIYRVLGLAIGVRDDGSTADGLVLFDDDDRNLSCWNPAAFTPIRPADSTFTAQMRALRPVRHGAEG